MNKPQEAHSKYNDSANRKMQSIISIFETYGWPGLVGIVLVLIIYYLVKQTKKDVNSTVEQHMEALTQRMTESMATQNSTLVMEIQKQNNNLIEYLIKTKVDSQQEHDDKIGDRMQLSSTINDKLQSIMETNSADRAFVIEFHNSNANLNGVPFAKWDCTYEKYSDRKLTPIENSFKNIPFASVSDVVRRITKSSKDYIFYEHVEDLFDDSPLLYSVLKKDDTKGVLFTAIYADDDMNNIMVGLIVLGYIHNEIPQIDKKELKEDLTKIATIINLNNKYSKI